MASGQYDNELLDLHAICGDGRCNENIALQAVHQVFHGEHDRLVGDIMNTLTTDTSGITDLADWQTPSGAAGWNGERLFQAARFVTEMEYQHLVFEEFARKVQPAINAFEPFALNQTDIDPAITAEFAHAVYRFGHSMLNDTIPRVNADGTHNDIELLDGFLNPAAYYDGGDATARCRRRRPLGRSSWVCRTRSARSSTSSSSNTLRNNLLGLPLDLPAINMTRARSEGIPPLNNVRRQIFDATNDGQLEPLHRLDRLRPEPQAPRVARQLRRRLRDPRTITRRPRWKAGAPLPTRSSTERSCPARTGSLNDDPATPCDEPGINVPIGCDESADNVLPPADSADFMFSTGAWTNDGHQVDHRCRRHRPVGRRPGRAHQPVRWAARQHVQLRVRVPADPPPKR